MKTHLNLDLQTLSHLYHSLDTDTLKLINVVVNRIIQNRQKTDRIYLHFTDLSIRAMNICERLQLIYLDELAACNKKDLIQNKNIGLRTIKEYDQVLKHYNLKWADDETNRPY